jgi:alkylation response protein AidB-like acyl-CoA dehydrogenase
MGKSDMTIVGQAHSWPAVHGSLCDDAQRSFGLTAEQSDLRRTVRQLLARRANLEAARSGGVSLDMGLWRTMCELGLTGLGVAEELGGSGGSFVEVAIVAEELGRTLAAVPFLSSAVLAVSTLSAAGADIAAEYLPHIVRGDSVATVVLGQEQPAGNRQLIATQLPPGAWSLTGHAYSVVGLPADLLLVFAQAADGLQLFAVSGSAAGLKLSAAPTLDLSRTCTDLVFDGTPARLLAGVGSARIVRQVVRRRAAVALAAEMLGGAVVCLEDATEYAKLRNQFGRPIGSFQAIKHRCADMFVGTYYLRPAVYYAAWAVEAGSADADLACHVAKAKAGQVYLANAKSNIQVHGGMGYTWEADAHLYLKRATCANGMFGSARDHRHAIGTYIRALASPGHAEPR